MKGNLVIGNNIKLIPKGEWKELEDINSLMDKIRVSPKEYLKIRNYIVKLSKLGIYNSISEKYSNNVTTEIEVIVDNDSRGLTIIIDDPDEINKFLVGEYGTGYDPNGEEHEINKENFNVLSWKREDSEYFYFEKTK